MAFVYILYSPSSDTFYTGSCLDIETRIEQHKNKEISGAFTVRNDDWELFHLISNLNYHQARLIESHIKRMKSKTYIRNLTHHPEITIRLIEKYKSQEYSWRCEAWGVVPIAIGTLRPHKKRNRQQSVFLVYNNRCSSHFQTPPPPLTYLQTSILASPSAP